MQQRQPIDPSKLKVINPGDFVTFELVNGSCFSGVIKEIGSLNLTIGGLLRVLSSQKTSTASNFMKERMKQNYFMF